MGDALFRHIEQLQGGAPWGRVLDAGTGVHSLGWVCSLEATAWVAVTAEADVARRLGELFGRQIRDVDRIECGLWSDPELVDAESFDTVVVDYLLGSMDATSPRFQDQVFARFAPHVGGRIYLVGSEPVGDEHDGHPTAQRLVELMALRDAACHLTGVAPLHEFPCAWVVDQLEASGFVVEHVSMFANIYRKHFAQSQAALARRLASMIEDRVLGAQLAAAIDRCLDTLGGCAALDTGVQLGADYVIAARRAGSLDAS